MSDRPEADSAEAIRRTFAAAWGEIGAAWGVAPSTATVQGYFLVHGGPLTEPEVRRALGLSHRAASLALAQCEEWGLIERAETGRRSGQRGPAAAAWVAVGDHWAWFRRVVATRRERETAPVLPVIERCARLARRAGKADSDAHELSGRLDGLLSFVQRFDRGVELLVRGEPRAMEHVFAVMGEMDDPTADRLWAMVAELEPGEMASALGALASMPPSAVRRLIGLAEQPALRKLLGLA